MIHRLRAAFPAQFSMMATMRAALLLACIAGLLLAALPAAQAQGPAPATGTVSVEELERLVRTLESEPDRQRLVEELKALIAVQRGQPAEEPSLGEALIGTLSDGAARMSATLTEIGGALLDAGRVGDWLRQSLENSATRDVVVDGVLRVAAVLVLGLLAELLMRLLLRNVRRGLVRRPGGLSWRLGAGLMALLLDLLPVAAFAAASYGSLPFLDPTPSVRLIAIALINAIVISQILVLLVRFVLHPYDPALRIPRLSDDTAAYLDVWLRRFIWLGIIGYVALEAGRLLGLPHSAYVGLLALLGLAIAILMIMVILQNRQVVAGWLKNHREDPQASALSALSQRLADTWHVVAILYVIGVYVVWLLRPGAGLEFLLRATIFTLMALALGWLLERAIHRLVRRWFAVSNEMKTRFPDIEERTNRYLPIVLGIIRAAIAVLTVLAVLFIWGFSSFSLLASEPGRQVVFSLLRIIGIVAVSLVLWEVGGVALERILRRATSKGRMPSARVRTMLPVARYIFGMVLGIIAVLMLLSEIGVEIGPLLAGAGIVGLAVGLGAQTLVKDLIAGFSLLMEDALAVGDVVRIGQHSGVVENMTVRTIRLRAGDGTVQTIPLGGVTIVENMTRDFSFAMIDCAVAYKEDVDKVVAILKSIGDELRQDPDLAPDIQAPIEIIGLDKFQESSVLIKARIKTYPTRQWGVLREFNRRLKLRFEKEGIEIPFPYRTLVLADETVRALAGLARSPDAPAALAPPAEKSDPATG